MFGSKKAKQQAEQAAQVAVRTYDDLLRRYCQSAPRYVSANRDRLYEGLQLSHSEFQALDLALAGAIALRAAQWQLPKMLKLELGDYARNVDGEVIQSVVGSTTSTALALYLPGIDLNLVGVCLRDERFGDIDLNRV